MKRPYTAPAVVKSIWIGLAPRWLAAAFGIRLASIRHEPGTWTRAVFCEPNMKGWRKP